MKQLTFLIVEDEALIAMNLKTGLLRAGHRVCGVAGKAEQAVEMARREHPDVILMDIRLLGETDGIEAARQIATFSSAPVIFTTGYSNPALKERAMALKPAAYLVKPVDVRQIHTVLEPYYGMG
jgi:DNA-binding NarL/FixJ family response regulator